MTIDEKRDALYKHCDTTHCNECVLKDACRCGQGYSFKGRSPINDAEAIGAYEIVFGDHNEEDETVIRIKSSKNIDNITIYFKEDK